MNFLRRLFGRRGADAAPVLCQLPDAPDWFYHQNRLPYPEWERIGLWMQGAVEPAERGEALNQAVRLWAAQWPVLPEGRIMCAESPEFILLTTVEPASRRWALQSLEAAHRAIVSALGGLAWTDRPGKRTVFLLPYGLYARYIASYYKDDYISPSAGVFLSGRGYPHIAVVLPDGGNLDNAIQRTMTHELTHFALAGLALPRWLDESLAMHFEDQLAGGEPSMACRLGSVFEAVSTAALVREFRCWWNVDRLQGFWQGDLWNSQEDELSLCYEMSRQIFRLLRQSVEGAPQRFRAFIGSAREEDAGEAASREHLGFSLGALAEELLGAGDWAPRPFR